MYIHVAHTIYLNDKHNQVARIIYQKILKARIRPPPVKRKVNQDIWWDQYIKSTNKVKKTSLT